MRPHNAKGQSSPRSTSVKPRTGHHTGHDAGDVEASVPDTAQTAAQDAAAVRAQGAPGFLEGFELEPDSVPVFAAVGTPPWPSATSLTPDSYYDFISLAAGSNVANGYGAVGLMCVVGFSSVCYGTVKPGTIFLFPGTYDPDAATYVGTPHLDGTPEAPFNAASGVPLHAQMCALLGQSSTNFIGFAANYPADPATMGYTSQTCNVFWFGTRTLPPDWQEFVYDALAEAVSIAALDREDLAH